MEIFSVSKGGLCVNKLTKQNNPKKKKKKKILYIYIYPPSSTL